MGPVAAVIIRVATAEDAGLILRFIRELAIYEKAESSVQTDEAGVRASLFGPDAKAHALICEADGVAIGYAVYFYNYSTWLGRNGIYLEDLYVEPGAPRQRCRQGAAAAHRAHRLSRKLQGGSSGRCCDWNEPAIQFYVAAGAKPQSEWTVYRMEGEALRTFAQG